jgi:hypothetical protein
LSLDAVTGAVTGIPTATYTTASVVFSVLDANYAAASATSTVSFHVVAASPSISATATTTAQSLTVGTAMASFSPLAPSGGATPYTYSVKSGTLPAGLSLNTNGTVTGIPLAVFGTAAIIFQVQDANNVVSNTTSTVSFTVSNSISATTTTTAQSLTVGTAMPSFSPLTPTGSATPFTYSVRSGTLPAGLVLNSVTGAVTGTPSAAYTTASVVFGVQDAHFAEASATSTVSFTVAALPAGYVFEGGLTWMPISTTNYAQPDAERLCAGTINGTIDWRLPTQLELSALNTSGLMNGQGWSLSVTWSSTPEVAGSHYYVFLGNGSFAATTDTSAIRATCVR